MKKILLYKGNTGRFNLEIRDPLTGKLELLGQFAQATFAAKNSELDTGFAVWFDTGAIGGVTIDAAENVLHIDPSQAQADALVVGSYVGQVTLQHGSGLYWKVTEEYLIIVETLKGPLVVF